MVFMTDRANLASASRARVHRILLEAGDELREARRRAGLRQLDVARRAGSSRSQVSRVESGDASWVSIGHLVRQATAVGLDPRLRFFPNGAPLRDAGQLALIDRFRKRLGESWEIRLEVPMPIPDDRRAWDVVLRRGRVQVGVEAITRLRDVQAQLRAAQLKRRDDAVDRLVLLVADSSANRVAVHAAADVLGAAFPIGTRAALAALTLGRLSANDALILL